MVCVAAFTYSILIRHKGCFGAPHALRRAIIIVGLERTALLRPALPVHLISRII
jgi:hypothetical protein